MKAGETKSFSVDITAADPYSSSREWPTVTIVGVNDAPEVEFRILMLTAGTGIGMSKPLGSDVDGDPLTWYTSVSSETPSWLTLDADGGYAVDTNDTAFLSVKAGQPQTFTFSFGVSDNPDPVKGLTYYGMQEIVASRVATPLGGSAAGELNHATEDTGRTLTPAELLNGFTGDDLSVVADSVSVTNGTISVTENGYLFTPDTDFNGEATLTYEVVGVDHFPRMVKRILTIYLVNDAPLITGIGTVLAIRPREREALLHRDRHRRRWRHARLLRNGRAGLVRHGRERHVHDRYRSCRLQDTGIGRDR
ncbi:cadherin-like domain-containing protein [Sphingomonas sp. MMS24-JH45]